MKEVLKNYSGILLLLLGITIGSIIGIAAPAVVDYIKPSGDIFLNLLFVSVVPLVFFAVSNSIASLEQQSKFGRIILTMSFTFLLFILIAAIFTICAVYLFPVSSISGSSEMVTETANQDSWGNRIVSFFTVGEFTELFSRRNMLALLIFAFLTGFAARKAGEKGQPFRIFIASGYEVMKELLLLIMKLAPIGLGAYFAYQVATLGPQLFGFYGKPLGLYYIAGIIYFLVFFSLYAFMANGRNGVKSFWTNAIYPTLTALSTCSSFATMPANLQAASKIGIPNSIANLVIPIGTTLHKNGSSMSSIIKIYVAFLIIGRDFFEPSNLLLALGITVFVSIVAGGIPNGGYIGEMLMISVYKLPQEAIPAVMIIGTLVDPLATVLNAVGDVVAAMFVNRFVKV
ncbi:dicarboxylate/amino acid:cation symporter [Chryseobacterium daecheongense]|uniref:Dicarboxylate/amino acid:cation symporter n=1 Tax=Chryseobacterium daecheongense TaxID=192389 RepID=A0A3N0W5R4_9FLAO|nr:dicarboxylate/amino acid:cation symporter [Chryseobacterium daecheongense]ROI00397.1 dicarboxylate/amino acid:cation symporter [Chryseobacterium daecheongense]TDX94636.1 Na+/H+-dicarboxylate symporter [Chryseobacterium daecheongense]